MKPSKTVCHQGKEEIVAVEPQLIGTLRTNPHKRHDCTEDVSADIEKHMNTKVVERSAVTRTDGSRRIDNPMSGARTHPSRNPNVISIPNRIASFDLLGCMNVNAIMTTNVRSDGTDGSVKTFHFLDAQKLYATSDDVNGSRTYSDEYDPAAAARTVAASVI